MDLKISSGLEVPPNGKNTQIMLNDVHNIPVRAPDPFPDRLAWSSPRIIEVNCKNGNKVNIELKNVNGRLDLRGLNFQKCDLKILDLSGADMTGANLSGADLAGVKLVDTILIGANLKNARLINADLLKASLMNATLDGADLRGARLNWANLKGASLIGANLMGAKLPYALLNGANFYMAKLGPGTDFRYTNYNDALSLTEDKFIRAGVLYQFSNWTWETPRRFR